jgi:hypothetical protein
MDSICNEVCLLVTAAFALTLVPGFRQPERSLLSRRDQGTALLVFLFLGLVEEVAVSGAGLLNERIVAVCAAGLGGELKTDPLQTNSCVGYRRERDEDRLDRSSLA